MIAEETRHPGLAHTTLTDIQVAELLTPAGETLEKVTFRSGIFCFCEKYELSDYNFHPNQVRSIHYLKITFVLFYFLGTFCSLLDKNLSPRSEMLLPLTFRTLRK